MREINIENVDESMKAKNQTSPQAANPGRIKNHGFDVSMETILSSAPPETNTGRINHV